VQRDLHELLRILGPDSAKLIDSGDPVAAAGADFIRTHDAAALRDGLKIVSALHAAALTY
jgi:dihydropteroate synthase